MATLKWLLFLGLASYAGLAAYMYVAQRSLMYFPEAMRVAPVAAGLPQAEEIVLDTADGEKIIAWHIAPRAGAPVVLHFHGNGGALHYRVAHFRELTADGLGLLALSYRGYGGSSGHPTEAGLIADARAAYDYAAARYKPERLVLWGESLGSGVAVALASERRVAAVVLEAPFTSAADIAADVYPYIPVRLLMKDQFHSDLRIAKVTAPVLVMHGERDAIVPIRFGERLYELVVSPKRFVRFPDGGHEDLASFGAIEVAKRFIAEQVHAEP